MRRFGDLVVFAGSLRYILAHPGLRRTLSKNAVNEVLLTGMINSGHGTLLEQVNEVLPGHSVTIGRSIETQCFRFRHALRSPEGPSRQSAQQFREALNSAISTAIGDSRPVAVALSGGIDSSAVAAAAVEVVGSANIHAFSWEFEDPDHPVETRYARQVCEALGIQQHRIFKITFDDFIDNIPAVVWHSESPTHWPKSFLIPAARHIQAEGFDKYLTGFGIGSHMGYLQELARVLRFVPQPASFLRYWKLAQFGGWSKLAHLRKLHPGFEIPHPRIYYLILKMLKRHGFIENLSEFFPPEIELFIDNADAEDEMIEEGQDILGSMQLHTFSHLVSCIDVTRSEKSTREAAGIHRVSPAHTPQCLPYAYFPVKPAPFLWSVDRDRRPGKLLLQKAYRNVLPDSVLFRTKSWDDAVVSRSWLEQGRALMLRSLPDFPDSFGKLGPGYRKAVRFWEPRSIHATGLSLAFWQKIFLDMPISDRAPTWDELLS